MSIRLNVTEEVAASAELDRDGEFPDGWTHCRVDDVFSVSSGGTPSRTEPRYWNGDVPWLSSGDIKTDEIAVGSEFITEAGLQNSTAKLCEAGSVVVVVRSGVLKHTLPVALLRRPAAINQDMKCFNSGDEDLNRWLALALRAASRDILAENREGTTVQSVKSETLREFSFPLPPLAEQRRIVGKLELLLGKVSSSQQRLSRVPGLLKRFRQSVLAAACSGKLTADWREVNSAEVAGIPTESDKRPLPPIADDERLFDAPSTWQWCRLGTLAAFINGDRGKKYPNKNEYVREGFAFINTGHIRPDGSLSAETMHFLTREKFDSLGSGKIKRGDLVYCLRGATLGKTAFVEPYEAGAIASSLVIIRLNAFADRKFAYYVLTSPYGKELVGRFDNGSAQPNLSADSVKNYTFPLPPLAEQQEIVRRVEKLFAFADQIEARLRLAQSHVDRLTQSLLAKAFRGELVPTEHALATAEGRDYESASELLARIQTKQHTTVATVKPKRKQRTAKQG